MRFILQIIILLNISIINAKSYFFNSEESKVILNKLSKNIESKEKTKTEYKISGIFYISDEAWTVWINEKPYTSIGQYVDFSIDEVSPENIVLTLDNGKTIKLSVKSTDT